MRGAVCFDLPSHWSVRPMKAGICLHHPQGPVLGAGLAGHRVNE